MPPPPPTTTSHYSHHPSSEHTYTQRSSPTPSGISAWWRPPAWSSSSSPSSASAPSPSPCSRGSRSRCVCEQRVPRCCVFLCRVYRLHMLHRDPSPTISLASAHTYIHPHTYIAGRACDGRREPERDPEQAPGARGTLLSHSLSKTPLTSAAGHTYHTHFRILSTPFPFPRPNAPQEKYLIPFLQRPVDFTGGSDNNRPGGVERHESVFGSLYRGDEPAEEEQELGHVGRDGRYVVQSNACVHVCV